MANKSILLLIISISASQWVHAMEQKKEENPPQPPLQKITISADSRESSKSQRHPSVSITPAPMIEPSYHQSRKDSFAVIKIEAPQDPQHPFELEVSMGDVARLTPAEIDNFISELIRQASIATFGHDSVDAYYAKDLKASLSKAFHQYLAALKVENGSDSSSSTSESSSEKSDTADAYPKDSPQHKVAKLHQLRNTIFKQGSFGTLPSVEKSGQQPTASTPEIGGEKQKAARPPAAPSVTMDADILKQWLRQELELREITSHEHEMVLRESAAENEAKLLAERRKARYALVSTIVITLGGAISTALTFLLTYYSEHEKNTGSN